MPKKFFISLLGFILGFLLTEICLAGEMPVVRKHARLAEAVSWGRSPFVLKESSERAVSGFSLSGILWDEKSAHAIVNDMVVSVGEQIGGCTVSEITPEKVVLNDGSQTLELRMDS